MSTVTLENWENARGEAARRPRGPKPVARGQRLSSTAWLDGEMVWHNGALGWRASGRIALPDAARIERARRDLDKLPPGETVTRRLKKWRLAHQLGPLVARDLASLCAPSRRRNPSALAKLAPLLVLESLGVELPHSPARALGLAWPHSRPALESVIENDAWPLAARELAAFVAGAGGEIESWPREVRSRAALGARWQRQINWLEAVAPPLMLEAARGDDNCARELVQLAGSAAPFAPDAATLANLARAHGIERALEVGAELARLQIEWPALAELPLPLPRRGKAKNARAVKLKWRALRRELEANWREILPALALRDPDAIAPFCGLCRVVLSVSFALARVFGEANAEQTSGCWALRDAQWLVEGAAQRVEQLALWGRAALHGDEPAALLELWRAAAEPLAAEVLAAIAACGDRCGAGFNWSDWFAGKLSATNLDALHDLSRAGGVEFARLLWERKQHRKAYSRFYSDEKNEPSRAVVDSWVVLARSAECPLSLWNWNELWQFLDASHARAATAELLDAARAVTPFAGRLICGLGEWNPSRAAARAVWPHLPALLRAVAPAFTGRDAEQVAQNVSVLLSVATACHELKIAPAQWPGLVRVALQEGAPVLLEKGALYETNLALQIALHLSAAMAPDALALEASLGKVARDCAGLLNDPDDVLWKSVPGARAVRDRPGLARALHAGLQVAPERALRALEHLALAQREHACQTLNALETPAPILPASWHEIVQVAPELEALARAYAHWKTLAGQAAAPPPGIAKILDWPRKWAREIEALHRRIAAQPQLQARLDNLRARLADQAKWRSAQRAEIAELLENATPRAAFAALEFVLEAAFRARLESLCGALPAEFALTEDWINALLLGREINSNRKLARALLRHEAGGAPGWRENLPGNAQFLRELGARGVDAQFYLSGFERARGPYFLWLENEPLGILQMGNRFNTCLSRGGCNAFSSVANAVEWNKRVVYARDRKGTIVGRQLWAVSQNFELIGFHIYSHLSGQAYAQMSAAFNAHAREFGRSCGLKLADAGEVASLVAPQWYDDGACAWSLETRAEIVGYKKTRKHKNAEVFA